MNSIGYDHWVQAHHCREHYRRLQEQNPNHELLQHIEFRIGATFPVTEAAFYKQHLGDNYKDLEKAQATKDFRMQAKLKYQAFQQYIELLTSATQNTQ